MGSLYRRALEIYNHGPHLRLLRAEENGNAVSEPLDITVLSEADASSEEEDKVLAELERAVGESRMRIDDETFRFVPTKKSVLLPLLVNLGAFLLVAAAVLVLFYFFERDRDDIVTSRGAITTAEGQLLEAVRSESEAALTAKDREITDIRSQLASINQQWEDVQAQADARLAQEEAKLRAQLQAELEAERLRLREEGLTAEEIEAAFAEIRATREAEIAAQVEELRRESDRGLAEQEESFHALRSEYETSLVAAREERLVIQEEADARIAGLNEELARREDALEQERQATVTQLQELQTRRERETLVLDQLIARYQGVNQLVAEERYDAALEELSGIREYLQDPAVVALPAVQWRLSTEIFIVSSIEDVIRQRKNRATTPSLAGATRMATVADRVAEANALFEAGEVAAATELYREAVSELPEVATALQRLEEAQELAETERIAAAEDAIQQGGALLSAAEYDRSLEQFRNALALMTAGREGVAQELTDGILAAGAEILRAENQRLQEGLTAARLALAERPTGEAARAAADPGPSLLLQRLDQIEAQLVSSATNSNGPRDDLASLLQAKVVTRRVLNAEPTRSRHPGLGGRLDSYFDALVADSTQQGRRLALIDLADAFSVEDAAGNLDRTEADLWQMVFDAIERLANSYPEPGS